MEFYRMGIGDVSFTALAAPDWSGKIQLIKQVLISNGVCVPPEGEKYFGYPHSSLKEVLTPYSVLNFK